MGVIQLWHDVLDSQLVDRTEEKIGRVDVLLLELEEGRPPRAATIVVGSAARAARVGGWMVAVRRAVRALFARRVEHESRIPFDAVRRVADNIQVDVDGKTLDAGHRERWLREHVICKIPGAEGDHK